MAKMGVHNNEKKDIRRRRLHDKLSCFYVFQKYVFIYRFFKCLYSSIIRISFLPSNHSSGTVKKV